MLETMTEAERTEAYATLNEWYGKARESRLWFKPGAPQRLTDEQWFAVFEKCGKKCKAEASGATNGKQRGRIADRLFDQRERPVGFGIFMWLMIGKILIEILLLWFRFQQSDVREA